mmetsp:Transcript_67452/g.200541  ORF Transcript_67452/g.200541 Transcript_67452/m.200541 type:complete len:233 (+) Transcript_67452:659-1357(+)
MPNAWTAVPAAVHPRAARRKLRGLQEPWRRLELFFSWAVLLLFGFLVVVRHVRQLRHSLALLLLLALLLSTLLLLLVKPLLCCHRVRCRCSGSGGCRRAAGGAHEAAVLAPGLLALAPRVLLLRDHGGPARLRGPLREARGRGLARLGAHVHGRPGGVGQGPTVETLRGSVRGLVGGLAPALAEPIVVVAELVVRGARLLGELLAEGAPVTPHAQGAGVGHVVGQPHSSGGA